MPYPIAQHFIAGFKERVTPASVKTLIQKNEIGGVILFSRNIESPKQVRDLNHSLQKISKIPLLMGVDQEGGRVARLREGFTLVPNMSVVGNYYKETGDLVSIQNLAQMMAREIRAVGFNWNFAPVADVHSNPKNPVIGDRSFSPDPLKVTLCAEVFIRGFEKENLLHCIKHFPGHGATDLDSHLDLPRVSSTSRLVWRRDIFPFRQLIAKKSVQAMMTAHVLYPEFDPDHCATLSSMIIGDLLRNKLGYEGLVVSDDLFMKAISDRYTLAEAALLFFEAGGDVVLFCHEPELLLETLPLIEQKISKSAGLQALLKKSNPRIQKIRKKYGGVKNLPSLDVLACKAHQNIVDKIVKG